MDPLAQPIVGLHRTVLVIGSRYLSPFIALVGKLFNVLGAKIQGHCVQCDQIGLLLKSLGGIYSSKISPNIGQL